MITTKPYWYCNIIKPSFEKRSSRHIIQVKIRYMKIPIVIISPKFTKAVSIIVDVAAITLLAVYYQQRKNVRRYFTTRNHTYCSTKRITCVILLFVIWLGLSSRYHKIQRQRLAYRRIRFEQEAYAQDTNENYLENRKLYSWRKYKV